MTIAVLEDDERRREAMRRLLDRNYPGRATVFFDNAPDMVAWLDGHLQDVEVLCLDHDLGPNHRRDGEVFDPGTGQDVVDFVATQQPSCPVLVHTSNYMAALGVAASEPDLLVRAGESVLDWSVLVGLVGEGQEIHTGEEGGLSQWKGAIEAGSLDWEVHSPPHIASVFSGHSVTAHPELDLTVSLRSHRAEGLHGWVRLLLRGTIDLAPAQAMRMQDVETYPMYLTRDLDAAKRYVRARYEGTPDPRYGLLTSSHAWRYFAKLGIRSGFLDLRVLKVARWFNGGLDDPLSACGFEMPVTEFQCQGLEVDMPIVCWGPDYRWSGNGWRKTAIRRQPPLADPDQILENAYRVLLTRGRDGLVIYVPQDVSMDETADVLIAAGVRPLPAADEISAGAPIVGSCGIA